MSDTAGTYISLAVNGGIYMVDRSCEGAIEVAYRAWKIEKKDSILDLTLWCGDDMIIAASEITEFILSTAAGRDRKLAYDVESESHRKTAFSRNWSGGDV